jgi:hypothetical protein
MPDVTLPTFYFDTAILPATNSLLSISEPTVTAIFTQPIESFEGIEPTSVVVTNPT